MFIRKRHVKKNGVTYTYYGIVETVRTTGKPRQKMLYNMGTRATIAECIAKEQRYMNMMPLEDLAKRNVARAMLEMPKETEAECLERLARYQKKIDWLKDVASKIESDKSVKQFGICHSKRKE